MVWVCERWIDGEEVETASVRGLSSGSPLRIAEKWDGSWRGCGLKLFISMYRQVTVQITYIAFNRFPHMFNFDYSVSGTFESKLQN